MKNVIKQIIKEELQRLNEIKALDAYNQYYKGLVDKENQEKDLSTYNTIVRLDPTFIENTENLGQYTKWIFRKDNLAWILNNIKTRRGEDLYKIKEALTLFEKAKRTNNLPIDKKDISKLNIQTLFDLTFELENQNLQSNTEKEKEIKEGAEKVFENDEWLIVVPDTEEAACYYGKGTKWCTAGNTNNQFDYYNRQGTLYILINKQDPSEKFQFHFESSQFMDVMDRQIDLVDFFYDNEEVHEFFSNKINNLDFKLCQKALEIGNTEQYDSFWKSNFTEIEKRSLISAAFEGDSNSDGYYTVSHVLNDLSYDGMEQDFKRDFLYALEISLGTSYDDENYDAKMFINYLGGINENNYDDIFRQVDFKKPNEIQKIFEIVQDFDNGNEFLSKYLQEEDIDINHDLLDTLDYLKSKFFYSDRNDMFSSNIATIKIKEITDYQKGLIKIEFIPKDAEGNRIPNKSVSGVVNYKNIIKYLTIPQIPLNESRKRLVNEKVTKTKVICDKCGWSWKIKDGGKDKYICHNILSSGRMCKHDNTPKKKLKEEEIILNEKCWKGYTQKGMKTMFGKRYPNCVKKIKEELNETIEEYSKWKRKNVTLRGIKELGKTNEVYGSFGKGLYTVPLSNKSMARQYGEVYFVVNAIPKNPKVVQNLNDAEILRYKLVDKYCKDNNVDYSLSFFENNTSMEIEMMKLGYDGLIIKGREMVNYTPNNIKYFRTENELERYHQRLS